MPQSFATTNVVPFHEPPDGVPGGVAERRNIGRTCSTDDAPPEPCSSSPIVHAPDAIFATCPSVALEGSGSSRTALHEKVLLLTYFRNGRSAALAALSETM